MKIDFSSPLIAINGSAIVYEERNVKRDMVLADAAIEALMTPLDGESGNDRFQHAQLAKRIYDEKQVEMLPAEAETIKQKIGKVYPQAVIFPAYTLLNG
jgi:hypothetical protein